MDLECMSGKKGGAHEGRGRADPLGRAPLPRGPPSVLQRTSCTHIYRRTLKLPEQNLDREFLCRKPP